MGIPGEIAEQCAVSRDNLSRVRQNLRAEQIKIQDQFEQTRQSRFSLMMTDLDIGFTFAKIAASSPHDSTKSRNRANAQRALDTVDGMAQQSSLTNDERNFIGRKISELRATLEHLAL